MIIFLNPWETLFFIKLQSKEGGGLKDYFNIDQLVGLSIVNCPNFK